MLRRLAPIGLLALAACTLSSMVRSQAAYDFQCPSDRVETEDVGDDVRATGCGKSAIYNYAAATPLRRAIYDVSCPAEKLTMTELGNHTIGVTGCGKKTSYSFVDGAWLEGPVTAAAP